MSTPRHISWLLALLPCVAAAQTHVAPLTEWLATVDSTSCLIVLSWNPSDDSNTMGYHICTGDTCREYAIVYGRSSSSYTCVDHSPLEHHSYAIHVFDSAFNVSSLTPPFGNMVLKADIPECSSTASVSWTPYHGMPGGLTRYILLAQQQPFDDQLVPIHTTDSVGPLHHTFQINPLSTNIILAVQAVGHRPEQVSLSNIVKKERHTADTASYLSISDITYDSISTSLILSFDVDTLFRSADYTLWRSVNGSSWQAIATLPPPATTYTDRQVNPFDSLHCYQLSVTDACLSNPRFSTTECTIVPAPPTPAAAIPNAILSGEDGPNGTFLPHIRGLMGDLYQLHIYDRFGNLVFHTEDPSIGWRPSASIPQGAYTYSLRVRLNTNDIVTYTGTVTVIK